MKYTPITEPKVYGCLCSPVPPTILPKEYRWQVYGSVTLKSGRKLIASWRNDTPTVQDIETKYREQIEAAECALLQVRTPMHAEIYERKKEDGEWYLVKQNHGYA